MTEFSNGDKVRIVKNKWYNDSYNRFIGTEDTIDYIEDGDIYLVNREDKEEHWIARELEIVEEAKETMTYEEALKLAIDGTKVCPSGHCFPGSYVFFKEGNFMWHSGMDGSVQRFEGSKTRLWKVWVKPEPPKPNPKFQPKTFVVNATGDIGIIAEHTGYSGNIPLYSVRFNGVTGKVKIVLETELSEVVL